jgi:RNA polymerase sigma factor (sigma-70 family)
VEAILARGLRLALSRRALRVANDERLVAEVRAGNRSAFEAVYDRHHAGILAFSRHMLGSREESEDVVQHTFAAAYQAMLADEREIALKAWLYAIARNRCLSVLRARREHVALEDADTRAPATAGLSVEVEQREDLRALLADLQRLPDDQRAALILAELGAHSHEEIARILGVPTPKIKALVFQARDALMNRRLARDADCGAIREQLAVLRGGARRRGEVRHHVAQCEGCRAFDAEVLRQRAGMAVLLPVVPALALKESSLIAAFAAGGSGAAAAGGGAAAAGGAAGVTAAGTAAAGGTVAGGTVAGGTVAGGTAAGGAAAAGGATGIGGSAMLTTGGAVLGAKVIGAKALTALALTGVAGGGYAAVQEFPSDPQPPPRTQASSVQRDQPQRQGPKTPLGGLVVPVDDQECRKQPAGSPGGCPKKPAADPRPAGRALGERAPGRENGDPDGDGVVNRDDRCPRRAGTVDGCPAPTATSDPAAVAPTPSGEAPADRDGDGVPNAQDGCPRVFGVVNGCPTPAGTPPTTAKPRPGDRDGDGIPNAKDDDRDGDGFLNTLDACPGKPGPMPGDGCPAAGTPAPTTSAPAPKDLDGDGIPNREDEDLDGDGIPNREDKDRDGDGFLNKDDACPRKPGPGTEDGCPLSATGPTGDRDGDGIPNAQDDDRDGDDFANMLDPCPNKPAPLPGNGCPVPADPTTTVPVPAIP